MPARILFFLLMLLIALPAQAQETLAFKDPADSYREKQILTFLENKSVPGKPWLLATIDLNGDNLDEYVARQDSQECSNSPFCSHYILAFRADTPILIGEFYARKVLISGKKTYGIRQILVYNHPHNDFRAENYIWSPETFRFTPENQVSTGAP